MTQNECQTSKKKKSTDSHPLELCLRGSQFVTRVWNHRWRIQKLHQDPSFIYSSHKYLVSTYICIVLDAGVVEGTCKLKIRSLIILVENKRRDPSPCSFRISFSVLCHTMEENAGKEITECEEYKFVIVNTVLKENPNEQLKFRQKLVRDEEESHEAI